MNKEYYIMNNVIRVLNSCQTREQVDLVYFWAEKLLLNHLKKKRAIYRLGQLSREIERQIHEIIMYHEV